ncbi:hypothetical protein GGH96_006258, partial [Coemansia sp. RSA 1972]
MSNEKALPNSQKGTGYTPKGAVTPERAKRKRVESPIRKSTQNSKSCARAFVARAGHMNTVSNLLTPAKAIQAEREAEAEQTVKSDFIYDVAGVLDAATPSSTERSSRAKDYAAIVCTRLESLIDNAQRSDGAGADIGADIGAGAGIGASIGASIGIGAGADIDAGIGAKCGREREPLVAVAARKKGKAAGKMPLTAVTAESAGEQADSAAYLQLVRWISLRSTRSGKGNTVKREPEMYPGIGAFLEFVADELASAAAAGESPEKTLKLVSFRKFDFVADDSDDYRRIDIALTQGVRRKGGNPIDAAPAYKDAVLLIEAKQYIADQAQAYLQLVLYSRNLFSTQLNRRFAWGLTVCGTIVRACIFVHDKVLSSEAMDVSTSDGRKTFVELLVNWSMCESWRLGYDPTIRRDADLDNWEVDVYDSETRLTRTYICENILCRANSTFGRHTRCLVAHEKPKVPASASDPNLPKVLIKDTWAHPISSNSDVVRDEVACLREIRDMLAKDCALDGTYPRLEAGGVVQIKYAGGVVDDTTQLILADIGEDTRAKILNRIHRRIVMGPVGEPLQRVESIDELIVVVGDVMAAHTAIAKQCKLLHRDLSVNNIIFHRDANGGVKGMLIDFDNACRITDMQTAERQDRTGVLPFMSIGDLEQSSVKRTVLDDWESLIYILCWLGTVGINQIDQGPRVIVRDLPIGKWRNGTATNIASSKREYLQGVRRFVHYILNHIREDQGYEELRKLLFILRAALFDNKRVSPSAQRCEQPPPSWAITMGVQPEVTALSDTQFLDRDVDPAITDSFARRAEIADVLADELLEVTQNRITKTDQADQTEQADNDGLIQDVTSVFDAAKPVDEKRRSCATRFAAEVCEKLEAVICRAQQFDDAGTGAKRSCEVSSLSVEPVQKRAKTVGGMTSATPSSFQASEQTDLTSHSHLAQWILFQSSSKDPSTPASHGPEIQLGVSALVEFVGQTLAEMAADKAHDISMRQLSTFQKVESIATDNDSYQQIDVALTMDTGSCTDTVLDYKDALMMVAVKQFAQEQHRAYRYLAYRTRKLFTAQLNRRFAWGLTVCGTTVRACLFVHDKVLSSEAMDVSTSDGRRTFVELLVNWSMCESWRLGYDPTIRYDADLDNWEVDVYDSKTQLTHTYIYEDIRCNVHSTFGQHTRCFVAHEKPEVPASASDPNLPKVLIKDTWAHPISSNSNVVRDEVAYLREIRDALAND